MIGGRLAGRVAVVTGAGSGIGAASAARLAAEGAHVVLADIDLGAARRVALTIEDALAVEMDVGEEASVQAGMAIAARHFGKLDIFVNNAGITGALSPLHETEAGVWDAVARVNGRGMFLALREAVRHMLAAGGGSVVNIASIAGIVASARDAAAYIYSKTGIVGLTRAAACDYAAAGIRVNAVAPGQVRTPLVDRLIREAADPEAEFAFRSNRHCIPGFIEPADIAAAIAFLVSDDARWITGIVLPVDGGYTAR